MKAETSEILRLIDEKSTVRVIAGTYLGLEGLRAVVDFDGGRVPAHFASPWRPEVNDAVWVLVVDGVAHITGPTAPLASDGDVVSVAGGLATVNTDVGQITATYNQGTTLTAGQQVKLLASGGYHVIGVKSTSPAPPPPPPPVDGGVKDYTQTFVAVDSGSFQSNWWTRRVYASASNQGLYFYGTKIADTIPSSAQILSVELYLNAEQIQGADPIITLHGHAWKPGGNPGLSGGFPIDIRGTGWWGLPTSIGDALKAGGGSRGIGFNTGGYNIFSAAPGESGALRIRYRA